MVYDHSAKEETHYMVYFFRLASMVVLYSPFQRQDRIYHGLYCTSRGALALNGKLSNGSTMMGWRSNSDQSPFRLAHHGVDIDCR